MNQRLLAIISAVVVVLLVAAGILYAKLRPSGQLSNASQATVVGKARAGSPAPPFSVATTTGLFDLSKTDRPVFLEVFATWCPHCQRETGVINQLYKQYNAKVAFIAIPGSDTGMDGTSPASQLDVLNFQQRFHVAYPLAFYDQSLVLANDYLQGGFPTVAVIGKNKVVSYLNSGEVSRDDLDRAIKKAL